MAVDPAAPAASPARFTPDEARRLLDPVRAAVRDAAAQVMAVHARAIAVAHKADASPVTEADTLAEAVLTPALQRLLPGVPVVAEEAVAREGPPPLGPCFWLVDPLDGTREFIARNGEFTVNVALVCEGRPVLGVVAAPAQGVGGQCYAGVPGAGAWLEEAGRRRAIACRPVPAAGLTLLGSRSHGDGEALEQVIARGLRGSGLQVRQRQVMGSSLKLCRVAEGAADLYARLGRTMAWDIAAGHAVLLAAGGGVWCLDGSPLRYGCADGAPAHEALANPGFVAAGPGAWPPVAAQGAKDC
jgi:3'(2'), 5'-bisphosphate nucleotidase